jgi:hypothetical protein
MDATVILCDSAEAVNGKLYLMGGGWNVLYAVNQPVNVAVAMILAVGWDEANRRHALAVALLDHDGNQVRIGDQPVAVGSEFEVGRPPGVKPGTALNTPLVMNFQGLLLPEGGYEFKASVGGEPIASRPFTVVPRPGLPGLPGGPQLG